MYAIRSYYDGGDPVAVLDIDPVLAELRESIQDPEYSYNFV